MTCSPLLQRLYQALEAELTGLGESTPQPLATWAHQVGSILRDGQRGGRPDTATLLAGAAAALQSLALSQERDYLVEGVWHNPQAFARSVLIVLQKGGPGPARPPWRPAGPPRGETIH